jgi:hypothetical protein
MTHTLTRSVSEDRDGAGANRAMRNRIEARRASEGIRAIRPSLTIRVSVLLALLVTSLVGCGMNRRYANGVIQQLPHSDVNIVYKWSDAPASPAGTTGDPASASERSITVVYPHPNPKYGRRVADVTLHHGPAHDDAESSAIKQLVTNPFRQQNDPAGASADADPRTMHLLLTREELEFLLRDLVADGFFERGERESAKDRVELTVTLDSRTTTKSWDRVDAFHNLADRVRAESLHVNRAKRASQPNQASATLLAPTEDDRDQSAATDIETVSGRPKF